MEVKVRKHHFSRRTCLLAAIGCALQLAALGPMPALAYPITRVSVASDGTQATGNSGPASAAIIAVWEQVRDRLESVAPARAAGSPA